MAPTTMQHPLDILRTYLKRGWPVLPVWGLKGGACTCPAGAGCTRSAGKHPLARAVPRGVHDATLDPARVDGWRRSHPDANWAVATGHPLPDGGHLVVLDIDPRNGGDEALQALEAEHCALPPTATVLTGGGGQHYYFRSAEALAGGVLAPGIDFKARGGYVLVPPSSHLSGRPYAWDVAHHVDDAALAALPVWIRERLAKATRPTPAQVPLPSGDACESLLGEAFALAGWMGDRLPDGKRGVRCPWFAEHSDGRGQGKDSSTVLLPPTTESTFGGFKCLHAHCESKTWKDVLAALPPEIVQQARAKHRPRPVGEEPAAPAGEPDWRNRLLWQRVEADAPPVLVRDMVNAVTILTHDPRWRAPDGRPRLRLNDFTQSTECIDPPWHPDDAPARPSLVWTDEDDTRVATWLRRYWDLSLDIAKLARAVRIVASANAYHPVREWFESLTWDNTLRLKRWLHEYLGADQNDYTASVGWWWMIAAVARVYKPGCKVDSVLILEGPQGLKKSTALRVLAGPEWFSDTPFEIGTKDAFLALRGRLIIELAELDALSRADSARAKAFFSSPTDTYRPPYGREFATFPRQCVFAGTVNNASYLRDETGNRRYWPVLCTRADLEGLARDRAQLWAEAVWAFKEGATWWPESQAERAPVSSSRRTASSATSGSRRSSIWLARQTGPVTVGDVLQDALHVEAGKWNRTDQTRVGMCLGRLKWVRGQRTMSNAVRQTLWFRPGTPRAQTHAALA